MTTTDAPAWLAIAGVVLIAFALAGYVIDKLDDWLGSDD